MLHLASLVLSAMLLQLPLRLPPLPAPVDRPLPGDPGVLLVYNVLGMMTMAHLGAVFRCALLLLVTGAGA